MAIFNPIPQKAQTKEIPALIMAVDKKISKSLRDSGGRILVLKVCYVRDQNVVVVNLQL